MREANFLCGKVSTLLLQQLSTWAPLQLMPWSFEGRDSGSAHQAMKPFEVIEVTALFALGGAGEEGADTTSGAASIASVEAAGGGVGEGFGLFHGN